MNFDPEMEIKIALAIGVGAAALATVIAVVLVAVIYLKACITRQPNPSSELTDFWAGFKEGFHEAVHWGPRRYFAPMVGAVAGAVDYTSAAWAKRPASTKRAETYARLLSALTKEKVADASYNKRLIEAILQANGDDVRNDRLVGYLPDDLQAFGVSKTMD